MKFLFSSFFFLLLCSCNSPTQSAKSEDKSAPVEAEPIVKPKVNSPKSKNTYSADGSSPSRINSNNKNIGNTISIPLGEYNSVIDFSKMVFSSSEEEQMSKQTMAKNKISMNFISESKMNIIVTTEGHTITDSTEYFMRNDSLFITRSDGQQPIYAVSQRPNGKIHLQNYMNMILVLTKK